MAYSHQWIAVDGATDTEIQGATDGGYTLEDADGGKTIKVQVSFTDDAENQESLTSEPTAAVAPEPGPLVGFTVVDASDQTVVVTLADGDALPLDDPDNGSYGIRADLKAGETIGSMRLELTGAKEVDQTENIVPYSLHGDDADGLHGESLPAGEYTLTATAYSERRLAGNILGTLVVSFTVTGPAIEEDQNTPAEGQPTISGTAQVGETLTAETRDIEDADGLSNPGYSYQWLAYDGTMDADITGATDDAYTLVADDAGKTIRVRVSFTDDARNQESLTSEPTSAVAVAPTVPDAPKHLNVSAHDSGALDVSWEAPASNGGSAVTGYRVQWKETAGSWDTPADVSEATVTGTTHTITGLTDGVEYTVRVIATNGVGDGPPSSEATGTPRETTPPELATATVNGATLTLTYDEALDDASQPAADAFSVAVGGVERTVDGVAVASSTVTLTLASAVTAEDTVTVGYAAPTDAAALRILDEAGNAAVSFSGQAATNETEEAAVPLTASLEDEPESHNGSDPFTFRIAFSEDIGISYTDFRDHSLEVTNGSATKAKRVDGRSDLWEVTVQPSSGANVIVVVPADRACDVEGAICARGGSGRRLSNRLELTVVGPDGSTPNTPAEGQPTITGTAQVGETLTAGTSDIADADGLLNVTYSYQWLADDVEIAGATSESYKLVADDVGKFIKVKVSFTDDANNPETLTSAPTAAVAPKPNSPATGAPTISGTAQVGETLTAGTSDIADADGLSKVVYSHQWIANDGITDAGITGATGDTYSLVADDAGKTIKVRVSFTDDANNPETLTSAPTAAVAAVPPGAPQSLNVSPDDTGTLEVSWEAPASDGGSAGTGYKVQWKSGAQEYDDTPTSTRQAETSGPSSLTHTITGLTDGVEHTVRVIGVNDAGDGPPSDEATATPISREERLRLFIQEDVVGKYETDHPWLRTTWDYMKQPDFDLVVIDDPAHEDQVTIACEESNVTGLDSCEAQELRVGANHLDDERVVIHEMAHIYTLANEVSSEPAPLGIAHLYFDNLGLGVNLHSECGAHELYADVMTIGVLGHVELVHWGNCNGTNANGIDDAQTQEALALVGSALDGEMPQWFADTYNDSHGNTDLERVWADLKAVEVVEEDAFDTRIPVVYQLRNVFGGYCDNGKAGESIFDDGATRNPWLDGGCVPDEPGSLNVTAGDAELSLSWETPEYDGGSPVEGYRVQWKSGAEEYDDTAASTRQAEIADPASLTHTITGLGNGVEYTVRVLAHNHNGVGAASIEVTAKPEAPNSPAAGAPTISGTAQVGETLTADTDGISDADGMDNADFRYQWLADDVEIAGASDDTYTLVEADEGKTIKVRVSFTDDRNFQEELTSEPTAPVAAAAEESSSTWSATLTVGSFGDFLGYYWFTGTGKLETDDEFSLDGNDYTVRTLGDKGSEWFELGLTKTIPGDFTLQVGGTSFDSADATIVNAGVYLYRWADKTAGLSDGDAVEVSLTGSD